jgi:ribose 5-phosphate isomerase B
MIALGSDHGGFALKQEIMKHFDEQGIEYRDFGCYDESSVHYPIYAKKVAKAVLSGECEKGILVCSTGLGISMAANRFAGIRAAVCTDPFCAKMTRLHNDANVLCLGGLVVGKGLAMEIVDTFLTTEFSNGERHIQRIQMIENE